MQLIFATYFYVFMEWLFFVTKPSFLSLFTVSNNLKLYLVSAFVAALLGLVPMALLRLIGLPLRAFSFRCRNLYPEGLVPAAFLTVSVTLLADNFSYTVFEFGIVSTTHGSVKILYLLVMLLVFLRFSYGFAYRRGKEKRSGPGGFWPAGAFTLVVVSIILVMAALVDVKSSDVGSGLVRESESPRPRLPNIILFASDGVEADHLSAYGYGRKTSPALDRLMGSALVVENALPNARNTGPSVSSMLSGKLPTTVKVLSPAHIFTGKDSYEHLPGILKGLGYRSLQECVKFFCDAAESNMRHAFDEANGSIVREAGTSILRIPASPVFTTERFFAEKLIRRVMERMLHLTGIEEMINAYELVMEEKPKNFKLLFATSDNARIRRAIKFMERSDTPFFMHIHLINHTHCLWKKGRCDHHSPLKRVFSKNQHDPWIDIYDDAILSSDILFNKLLSYLVDSGKLDNTLIVYSSDHGSHWRTDRRVPLIFLFPGGEFSGRIKHTAQLIDVAPTILDYLDVPIPDWMEGRSLLGLEQTDQLRPVYTALRGYLNSGLPYYGLSGVALNICNQRYELTLSDASMRVSEIPNHTAPCLDVDFPTEKQAARRIEQHLTQRGFPLPGTVDR